MLPVLRCRLEMLLLGLCLPWRRMQAAAQVQAPGSSGTRAVSAGLCCKKPLARRLKQRFVVLLLCLGKKRSQVEHCPVELARLLIPGVDRDLQQRFVMQICPCTRSCLSPA